MKVNDFFPFLFWSTVLWISMFGNCFKNLCNIFFVCFEGPLNDGYLYDAQISLLNFAAIIFHPNFLFKLVKLLGMVKSAACSWTRKVRWSTLTAYVYRRRQPKEKGSRLNNFISSKFKIVFFYLVKVDSRCWPDILLKSVSVKLEQ